MLRPVAQRRDGSHAPRCCAFSDSVTLIHGDCRDVLPLKCETCFGEGVLVPVGGEESKCPNCDSGTVCIDAIISDPPYGMGLTHGNRAKTAKQKDAHLWGKQWGMITGDDKPFDPSPWLHSAVTVLWGRITTAPSCRLGKSGFAGSRELQMECLIQTVNLPGQAWAVAAWK